MTEVWLTVVRSNAPSSPLVTYLKSIVETLRIGAKRIQNLVSSFSFLFLFRLSSQRKVIS